MPALDETLTELEALGMAQNRKVYARHGVREEMYGVSYADLGKLRKKIQIDHELAEGLWASGNHDAMVLATMVADPGRMTSDALDAWARDLDSYVLADALTDLVSKTPWAREKFESWGRSDEEFVGQVGWGLLGYLAGMDRKLTDDYFQAQLETIEREIHSRKNRVRHSMNMALIAIGGRTAVLKAKAQAAARRIGKVEVDHGETGCKTPEAIAYIDKMWARRRVKKATK